MLTQQPSRVTISSGLTVLAFVMATIWFTFPQVVALDSVPAHNDPMFTTWRLAWVAHQLRSEPMHLLNANIVYPTDHALLFSDAFPLLGLFATPLIWSGVPPIVTYNILILAAFLFTSLCAFVFIRHLTGSTLAGLLGGLIYGFAPARFGHYMHQELLWTGWIPLALWGLHRTIETARWRYALTTGLSLVAQTYSSIYYGIFLASFLALIGFLLLVLRLVDWRSLAFKRLAAAAVLSAVCIAPYVYLYRQSQNIVGPRPQSEVAQYSARPQSYLAAPSFNRLYGWTFSQYASPDAVDETQLFPGIAAVVLAVIGLWPPISRVRVAYAVASLIAFDFSLGFNGLTYRLLFDFVPIFQELRATARFSVLVQLTIALFAGYGFARLLTRAWPRPAIAALLVVGVSGVVIGEYTNRPLPLARAATRPSSLSRWLTQQPPHTVLLELPVPRNDALPGFDPHYMFESTFHWRLLVNGYTAFVPPRYSEFLDRMVQFPDERSAAAIRESGADLIILHPRWFKTSGDSDGLAWLQKQPDFRYEGAFTDHAGSVLVFRHLPSSESTGATR